MEGAVDKLVRAGFTISGRDREEEGPEVWNNIGDVWSSCALPGGQAPAKTGLRRSCRAQTLPRDILVFWL